VKKGYMFSILIAMLLGFFILVSQYYLVVRPETEIYTGLAASREITGLATAHDIAGEFSVTRGAHVTISEAVPAPNYNGELSEWQSFFSKYAESSGQNVTLENTNSSKLGTRLWLAGKGVDYVRESNAQLNHSGNYLGVNIVFGSTVNSSNCALDPAGATETRVVIDSFDSGLQYTSPGSSYSCFVNFSDGKEVTVDIDANNRLSIDYSNAPASYTQNISFDSGDLYVVFDKYNESLGASMGWNESFNGTKKYAVAAGMNIVVADIDSNGAYDYAFVDVEADGYFNSGDDKWYLREGIADLGGKVFYIRFDLGGNWVVLYNALGVSTGGSSRGVVL
jgi:hypothetical protein